MWKALAWTQGNGALAGRWTAAARTHFGSGPIHLRSPGRLASWRGGRGWFFCFLAWAAPLMNGLRNSFSCLRGLGLIQSPWPIRTWGNAEVKHDLAFATCNSDGFAWFHCCLRASRGAWVRPKKSMLLYRGRVGQENLLETHSAARSIERPRNTAVRQLPPGRAAGYYFASVRAFTPSICKMISHSSHPASRPMCVRSPVKAKNAGSNSTVTRSSSLYVNSHATGHAG